MVLSSGPEMPTSKQKTRPVTQTLKPDATTQYRTLKLLGLSNSEPLKHLRSSCSQMFFKIASLKTIAIFTGKTCVGISF